MLCSSLLLGHEKNQIVLETLGRYSLHQKTFTLLAHFPELDSLLNCFIHRPQKEKKTNLKPQSHPPKTKTNPPSKQPGVWATYRGFFLSTNNLIKNQNKTTKSPQKHWNLRGSHVFEVGWYCISFLLYSCLSQKVINVKQLLRNRACLLIQK